MNRAGWQHFLDSWRAEVVDRLDDVELVGGEPAAEPDIAAAEERLGLTFPPSYRAFLSVTNGWGPLGPFIDRLFRADEVERFASLNPDWVEAYGGGDELESLVQISDVGDSAVLLLNPTVQDGDGEWEAWFFATWGPDEDRYASFEALMEDQRATFERLVERRPLSVKQLDRAVKKARSAALAGDVDGAEEALMRAATLGHRTARMLLVQLLAFQHRWDEVIAEATAVHAVPWEGPGNAFDEDLCPALGRAALETGRWRDAEAAVDISPDANIAPRHSRLGHRLLGEMRKRGGIDCHFPDFPNEPFESAVQQAKRTCRGGRPDDAWTSVVRALPGWVSIRLDQLAPTPLLADPDLGPLITATRGREILSTPRGGSIEH